MCVRGTCTKCSGAAGAPFCIRLSRSYTTTSIADELEALQANMFEYFRRCSNKKYQRNTQKGSGQDMIKREALYSAKSSADVHAHHMALRHVYTV